jgi:hypothetical protein
VNRAFEGTLADGVMFERRMFHALFATADQKEGMDAFVNKAQGRVQAPLIKFRRLVFTGQILAIILVLRWYSSVG